MAMDGQALILFPPLNGADFPAQVSGDLFPGVQPVGGSFILRHKKAEKAV